MYGHGMQRKFLALILIMILLLAIGIGIGIDTGIIATVEKGSGGSGIRDPRSQIPSHLTLKKIENSKFKKKKIFKK